MFHKHCLDGNLIPVRVDAHTKHVSDHRLHSKSREVRKSFTQEISLHFVGNKAEFIRISRKLGIESSLSIENTQSNYSSSRSSGTPESKSSNDGEYW